MKRKFKCVYPAVGGGWYAKRKGTYLGHAATEKEAARLVQAAEDQEASTKIAKPTTSRPAQQEDSRFHGVCYHTSNRGYVAQVKFNGKYRTVGGLHRSPLEAAKTIQKQRQLKSLEVLKKTKRDMNNEPFRARFRALEGIFCDPAGPALPGDLEAAVHQYQHPATQAAFQEEPGLEQLCELSKIGPIKDYLVAKWKQATRGPGAQSSQATRVPDENARAHALYKLLADTAAHFSGQDLKTPWIENCGRFVSNHSGFVPLLHRLHVVRAWRPGDKGPKLDFSGIGGSTDLDYLILNTTKQGWVGAPSLMSRGRAFNKFHQSNTCVCLLVPNKSKTSQWRSPLRGSGGSSARRTLLPFQRSTAGLVALVKTGDALQRIPVPMSGLQWEAALESMKSARRPGAQKVKKAHGKKENKKKEAYLKLWSLRSHWFPIITSSKKRFDIKGLSLRRFAKLLPDAGDWVLRLAPRQPYTVEGLFSEVNFRASPLLFSCYACLFADAGVIKYTAEQIEESEQRLKKALKAYRAKHGIWPHPAVLLRDVLG